MTATEQFQAPLQDYQLFASTNIDEAREYVGNVFCPHRLTPSKRTTQLDALMHHVRVSDHSSLNFLKYGAQVTVEPGALQDFFNVQIQLSGNVNTRCGKETENIIAGNAAVLSPTEYVSMDWMDDSSMLIYCVDRKRVERMLSGLLCDNLHDPIVFATKMNRHTKAGAGWLNAVNFLLGELEGNTGFLNYPGAAETFEGSLITSLLYGQQHNYSHRLLDRSAKAAPSHVKRVEAYILANAGKFHFHRRSSARSAGECARAVCGVPRLSRNFSDEVFAESALREREKRFVKPFRSKECYGDSHCLGVSSIRSFLCTV